MIKGHFGSSANIYFVFFKQFLNNVEMILVKVWINVPIPI